MSELTSSSSSKASSLKASSTADTSAKFANKTLQDYEVISVIGNGSFGTCYKVRDKQTNELFAWKGIDYDELSESKKASLVSEINVLRQLQHPNIVQYYHHLVNHEAKSIFIVMECCEGGDLAQLITKARSEGKRFEEKYIWRVLFQICKALQLCHNKIKEGTILHRDIKPANIFLDNEGNAKLGDFGLARVLRRNESFAQSFVGTPYYMSPEIVKGAKYDRKSDVWAVGCLVYEMCALRPPFKGQAFEQLSANISNGKFSCIPEVYSKDLQQMIAFMLEVENEQRPSIEVIIRHPVVVRNINDLGNEFPKLVAAEVDFYVLAKCFTDARCKLDYPDFSSTMHTDQYSFNVGYGQRRLSITGVFTPDLRAELFYSAKRRIFPKGNAVMQQSDPELYESIRRDEYATIDNQSLPAQCVRGVNPNLLTKDIFDEALLTRLHAIRAQENLLQQKEAALNAREQQLNEQEKRLHALELALQARTMAFETKRSQAVQTQTTPPSLPQPERARLALPPSDTCPPPIPPRKPAKHDDTYCTIEPNDSMLQFPTVAKLNLATLPAPKAFPTLRKVTFQSPKKFITYEIESTSVKSHDAKALSHVVPMQTSVSSKGSDESGESTNVQQRRKSILSIFGLSRNNKETNKHVQVHTPTATVKERASAPVAMAVPSTIPPPTQTKKQQEILAKCETSDLNNMWTKEHKRAAFDLLAAMNAAERKTGDIVNGEHTTKPAARHKFRQSVRDRHTSSLQRSRLRRSLMAEQTTNTNFGLTRQQLLV